MFYTLKGNFEMEFIKELWLYMKVRKKIWLLPILIIFLAIAFLIFVTEGTALAPFIYSLF